MQRWGVDGADRKTGKDVKIEVFAPTQGEAEEQAQKHGVMVSSVTALPPREFTPREHIVREEAKLTWWESTCLVIFLLIGVWSFVAFLADGWLSPSAVPSRFMDDNAIGATANALEEMQRRLDAMHRTQRYFGGMFCLALAALVRLRASMRR